MSSTPPRPLVLALAPAFLLAAAGAAWAVNYGRVSRPYEAISTEITPEGDVDDYTFEGAKGFVVSATVKRAKTADLAPILELVAPDGSVEATGKPGKSSAAFKKLLLQQDGRYALRVRGSSGSGGYTLTWSLKPAKVAPIKNELFPQDSVRSIPFAAGGGTFVSWKLKYSKGLGQTGVVGILDPDGNPVPYVEDDFVVTKGASQTGKNVPIPEDRPGGDYVLLVQTDFAATTASIAVKVAFPKAKKARVSLSAAEPALTDVTPALGGFGVPVTLNGSNLGTSPQGVFFGGVGGTEVLVTGGAACSVKPPTGTGTVDVLFVAQDGQVAVLLSAFGFYPPPTPASFDPLAGPATGGQTFTVYGSGFRSGEAYKVRIGVNDGLGTAVLDPSTLTCTTPSGPGGSTAVRLFDQYGQSAPVPGNYEFKTAPSIFSVIPNASPVFGNIPMTITGTGFRVDDSVYIGGDPVPSTPFLNPIDGSVLGHSLTIPPHAAPGKVDVEVRDSFGQSALRVNGLGYYAFTRDDSLIASAAFTGGEDWGGVSNAALDKDGDGKADFLLVAHTAQVGSRPGTRLLERNAATGVFEDKTATKMPAPAAGDDFGANKVLVGRMNNPAGGTIPGVYLSRPGTGVEAKTDSTSSFYILPWGRILFPDTNGVFTSQPTIGTGKKFSISSIPHCDACWNGPKCELIDYDFRSVSAAMGDLDGDGDQDVILVNDTSINRFKGSGTYAVYIGCGFPGAGRVTWAGYTTYTYGSAMRICLTSSGGGLTDNTKSFLTAIFTVQDDFRAVAATIADMDADFLNDVVITWNGPLTSTGGGPLPATRAFKQGTSGTAVTYKSMGGFLPPPATASDDDWRGDAVAAGDLNNDFYRDLVVSLNGPVLGGSKPSTRILVQNPITGKLGEATSTLLPALPSGDDARAKVVLVVDLDKDQDNDIVLSTPDDISGNRRTRFLLNAGSGNFLDASSIFPSYATDNGNALAIAVADVDGDGDLDLILTDSYQGNSSIRRTRIWRQDR